MNNVLRNSIIVIAALASALVAGPETSWISDPEKMTLTPYASFKHAVEFCEIKFCRLRRVNWINFIGRRHKQHVAMRFGEQFDVAFGCARVFVEVFWVVELRRIDKNAHDRYATFRS